MSLIKILLLDDDDEYSSNLCNFLTHNYSETMLVNYCSDVYKIEEWIKKIDPDILLTCEKYYCHVRDYFQKNIIILTSGTSSAEMDSVPSVYKYRNADKIAGDIVNSFIKAGNIIKTQSEKNTKVISVYSAAGSVGKTSIASGVGSICSLSGLSVFYLNFEQFQSTEIFFSGNSEYSVSDIIYYAKDRDKNLTSKIKAARDQDPVSNVYFFNRAGNVFELNELVPGDVEYIVQSLRECAQYDLVVIDMDSQLSKNSLKIFELSDEILYILTDEEICLHKTKLFMDNINLLSDSSAQNTFLAHKFVYVANKVSNQAPSVLKQFQVNKFISIIPFDLKNTSVKRQIFQSGGPEIINNSLKEIARRYII